MWHNPNVGLGTFIRNCVATRLLLCLCYVVYCTGDAMAINKTLAKGYYVVSQTIYAPAAYRRPADYRNIDKQLACKLSGYARLATTSSPIVS